jgi:hypothetical protein
MTELSALQVSEDPSATLYRLPLPSLTRRRARFHEERENAPEDSGDAESNPTTSSAPDVVQNSKPPSESVQRTYSSYRSREFDSSAPYHPNSTLRTLDRGL